MDGSANVGRESLYIYLNDAKRKLVNREAQRRRYRELRTERVGVACRRLRVENEVLNETHRHDA